MDVIDKGAGAVIISNCKYVVSLMSFPAAFSFGLVLSLVYGSVRYTLSLPASFGFVLRISYFVDLVLKEFILTSSSISSRSCGVSLTNAYSDSLKSF